MSLYTEWGKIGKKKVYHSKYIFNNHPSHEPNQEIYYPRARELGYMFFNLR